MSDYKIGVNLKKSFILLLTLVFTITLVACGGSQSKIPYGSISDDAYISLSDITITEKQLYDEFRLTAIDSLAFLIDEALLADELAEVEKLEEDYLVTQLNKLVNETVFGVATAKGIADLDEKHAAQAILRFANSAVITFTGDDPAGSNLDSIVDYFLGVVEDVSDYVNGEEFDPEATYDFGHETQTHLVERFSLSLAKYSYARKVLVGVEGNDNFPGEMFDQDSNNYISEDALVNYFKNNIQGRYDVSPLIINFGSVLESEQARFKYAIKENSNGNWFKLPNISNEVEFAEIKNSDVADKETNVNAYAKQLLTDQNIDFDTTTSIDYRTTEYRRFYNSYQIKSLRDHVLVDTPENNEVLNYFLRIYDDLYQTNYTVLNLDGTVSLSPTFDLDQLITDMTLEYNSPLFNSNATLRNYIYNTLDAETNTDEDALLHYSKGVQELGGKQFLVYLLSDDSANDFDVLDESDEDNIKFNLDNADAVKIRDEALLKVIEQRLTTTYINNQVAALSEDLEIDIFDPIIRSFYELQNEYTGSKNFKDNDTLAIVNEEVITVDQLFTYLDKTVGFSTALDMIQRQVLDELYYDQITDEEIDRFEEQFRTTLDSFSAGNFAQQGFPQSIGKEQFILLAFGADSVEKAIYNTHILPRLRQLYFEDYENHYGVDDNIYSKWADLSALLYEEESSVTVSHLLISIDRDFDGLPDDPNLLSETDLQQLEVHVANLINDINLRAKLSSNMNDGLNNVITAYGDATRYEMTYEPTDPYREDVWVEYKQHGLELVYQSLGQITNQSNFPTAQSGYDQKFFDYTYDLSVQLKNELALRDGEKGGLVPLYGPDQADFSLEAVRTAFGWHLVLITDIQEAKSAKVEEKDARTSEFENPFVEGEKLSSLNQDETLSYRQILIHIKEGAAETGVESLNSAVKTAISTYFSPIKSLYDGDQHRLELGFRLLERYLEDDLSFSDASINTKLNNIRQGNINQLFNFAYFENPEPGSIYELLINERYAAIYGQWFNILEN